MGHTKPADLEDLQDILDTLRTWDGIKEKSRNVFYFRSKPFLHFHDSEERSAQPSARQTKWSSGPFRETNARAQAKGRRRWADVRHAEGEKLLEIPFHPTARQKSGFFKDVERCYKSLLR